MSAWDSASAGSWFRPETGVRKFLYSVYRIIESLSDVLILKAAGAPLRPSFFCLPKRKKAKKRAPC
jgi:hypothetical protein